MSYRVRTAELENMVALSPEERYSYFIYKVADWSEVWGIRDETGWACARDSDGIECLPVWPAEAFARHCCVGEWSGRHPESISLDTWIEKWLPGLAKDGRRIAVFPVLPLDKPIAVTVIPGQLSADLDDALAQFGDDDASE